MGRQALFCFFAALVFSTEQSDCIIEALANPEKEKMKHDDTTISSWLQSTFPLLSMLSANWLSVCAAV